MLGCSSEPTAAAGGAIGGGGQGFVYFARSADLEIHKLNLGDGTTVKLGKGESPHSAPDGKLIFTTPSDLAEANEDLATHRVIIALNFDAEKSNNGFKAPQLSPDGTRVAFTSNDANLYVANRADGKILSRIEIKGITEAWYRPTWTPDGRVVAAGGSANPGLFISDANVTVMKRFDPMLARPSDPAVSPDGSRVAFVLNDHLHVLNIDGTGLKRIDPSDDSDSQPAWSPDGSKLIFRVSGRLKIIAAEGGASTDLFDLFPALKDKFLILGGQQPVQWK